jgi:hypothetical protein
VTLSGAGGGGEPGQRGDVDRRHLGQIGKVHLVDGVAERDIAFLAQILVLRVQSSLATEKRTAG